MQIRKKGGKRNVNSLKGKHAAKDTGMYKQLLCEESEGKFSSLACRARHFFRLVHETSEERSFVGGLHTRQRQYRDYINYGKDEGLTLQSCLKCFLHALYTKTKATETYH